MKSIAQHREAIDQQGFSVVENIFTPVQCEAIAQAIKAVHTDRPTFRQTNDLFAIRQFLKEVPAALPLIFTETLQQLLTKLFGASYFVVKSIYFDKPGASNWFVAYHQDLTISVDQKVDMAGFGPWTLKQEQFAVQPPLALLENNFTIRIHLDDTDENNGALRVIPQSHGKGVYRAENINWDVETEACCNIAQGGVMIMRPLLLHASSRTTNGKPRRVVHIEFSAQALPEPLQWSEQITGVF